MPPIDISALSADQLAALYQHFFELDQVRLALNNRLTAALLSDPDLTERQRKSVTAWAFDQQEISNRSDAVVAHLVTDATATPSTIN